MDVHCSNLALFEKPLVETAVESIDWVHFAPDVIPKKDSPLSFDIPSNATIYTDLGKTLLQVKVRVTHKDGSDLTEDDQVALVNLGLSSLFSQMDVSLNQKLITTSVGSNHPYKAYIDVLLNSTDDECASRLQSELFYKDTAGAMDEAGLNGGNLGHYNRMLHTNQSQILTLEGGIRVDICQQDRLIVNGVAIRIKMIQNENCFRLTADGNKECKLHIEDAVLKVCRVKVKPEVLIAQNEILKMQPALYPFWRSDIKTYSVSKGNYDWCVEDVYRGSVPNVIVLALCSTEAFNGNYNKNPFNFQHYHINFLEVTIDGMSAPSEALQPNFQEGEYTSSYLNLFGGGYKKSCIISMKDFPSGYSLFLFNLQSQTGGDLYSREKHGNVRVKVKFAKPLQENVTAIVYAKFPAMATINASRNVILDYKS